MTNGNPCGAIFSADRERWQLWASTTRLPGTDADGRFYALLPAGSYLALALPATACSSRGEAMQDFDALEWVATRVEIDDGQTGQLNLTTYRPSTARDWK
jgi:hypothetical protein